MGLLSKYQVRLLIGTADESKVKTVASLMRDLNHDYINILKIDTEGGEFEDIQNMHQTGVLEHIGQLMFEFHYFTGDPEYGTSPGNLAAQSLLKSQKSQKHSIH